MSEACRTLRYMGCSRQAMHHVAIQQSVGVDLWQRSPCMNDPLMLIWLDENGCDGCNTIHKYGYSLRGMPLTDHQLLVQSVAIPIMSIEGIHDVYTTEGTVDGQGFSEFEKLSSPCSHAFQHQPKVRPLSSWRMLASTICSTYLI